MSVCLLEGHAGLHVAILNEEWEKLVSVDADMKKFENSIDVQLLSQISYSVQQMGEFYIQRMRRHASGEVHFLDKMESLTGTFVISLNFIRLEVVDHNAKKI